MDIACASCLLRPLVPADAESLAHHANDRDVWLNLRDRFPHPYSVADALAYIAYAGARPIQTSFGIIVDGDAAGNISLIPGHDIERASAELGYWLGRAHWNRGIVTEAVRASTRYAVTVLDVERVFAVPFLRNPASARVLKKAGFVHEGRMRRSAIKDGVVLDQDLYAAYRDVMDWMRNDEA